MYLTELTLRNVRLFLDETISFRSSSGDARMWTVLTGINGVCKTTVLQAIALAASGASNTVVGIRSRRRRAAGAGSVAVEGDARSDTDALFDYLAEEVVAAQPPEVRSFLTETAILDRFTPALASSLTGRDDADEVCRHLIDNHLFTGSLRRKEKQQDTGQQKAWPVGQCENLAHHDFISSPRIVPVDVAKMFDSIPILSRIDTNRFGRG